MARDIAGLLTGISSTQQPVQQAVPGTPGFRGQFGAARAQGLGAGLGGLMRRGAPSTQEQIQGAISQLDVTNVDDLTKLAKVQLAAGDTAGAARIAAQINAIKEKQAEAGGIGKINPQQYTPESVQAYLQNLRATGQPDYSLLELIDPSIDTFKIERMKSIDQAMKQRSEQFSQSAALRNKTSAMQSLLKGMKTGKFAEVTKTAKGYLQALFPGRKIEGLAELEVFNALSNQLALLVRNPKSDMGLPGSTSNRDLDFLIQSVPNLQTSPGGNELLLELYEISHQLKVDVMNEQNRIMQEYGGIPPVDLEQRLDEFVESNFRLPEGLKARIEGFTPDSVGGLTDVENNVIDELVNAGVEEKTGVEEETPSQRLATRDKRKLGE
jgi:hypothetical protein